MDADMDADMDVDMGVWVWVCGCRCVAVGVVVCVWLCVDDGVPIMAAEAGHELCSVLTPSACSTSHLPSKYPFPALPVPTRGPASLSHSLPTKTADKPPVVTVS